MTVPVSVDWLHEPLKALRSTFAVTANDASESAAAEKLISAVREQLASVSLDSVMPFSAERFGEGEPDLAKLTGHVVHVDGEVHYVHPNSLLYSADEEAPDGCDGEEWMTGEQLKLWLPRQTIRVEASDGDGSEWHVVYVYGSDCSVILNGEYDFVGVAERFVDEETDQEVLAFHVLLIRDSCKGHTSDGDSEVARQVLSALPEQLALGLCAPVTRRLDGGLVGGGTAVGALLVNVIVEDVEEADGLIGLLRSIMPCVVVEVGEEALSKGPIYPHLPDASIRSSCLGQLRQHSLLILDERRLESGTLSAQSVRNMQALTQILQSATIPYDLEFSMLAIPVNAAVVAISLKSKAILSSVAPFLTCRSNGPHSIEPAMAACAKRFIRSARMQPVMEPMPEEVAARVEADFCHARSEGAKQYSAEKLHQALAMSRVLARIHGRECVTASDWQRAFELSR